MKHPQVWPHQFVIKLDSTTIAYKDLNLPHFVYGYIDCIRHSAISQQPVMLSHLEHLMDLASRFQWPAVRAFHSRVLKAIEQGATARGADFSRFQTGILVPSQELPFPTTNPVIKNSVITKKIEKDSICKDWNFSGCNSPCATDKIHICLICRLTDHKAPACPKHHCSPSCTWNYSQFP